MSTVIFNTESAVFKFALKEVKQRLICKKTEYAPDEITQLLDFISTDSDETILSSDGHDYFGYVALDLISAGKGKVTCNICGETYEAGQLKQFAIGHGKSPFDINPEQKGGFRLFGKRKNPSLFGGKGYTCPNNHELIAMETWRT
jgi:hypothetical protein